MKNYNTPDMGHYEIFAGTLVRLHKILKEEDQYRAQKSAERNGEDADTTPTIIIDFSLVTSIQRDFKHNGTVIMDRKTAVIVVEPLEEVLQAWIEVKENLMGYDPNH